MTPLPLSFQRNGYTYTQLHRQNDWAIYAMTVPGWRGVQAYEVFKVLQRPEHTFPNGVVVPAHEAQPGDEKIGCGYGKCFRGSQQPAALAYFKAQSEKQEAPSLVNRGPQCNQKPRTKRRVKR